ncbi:HTH_38 domain-containing protein [Trichonephila clavipes]|nr:HTH_38 domain-containing protein [Trichonephila clavipes]
MLLRRRRSHYQQLTKFERGLVVRLQKVGFSFPDIAERLNQNVSTLPDCWEQWSWDGTASRRLSSELLRDTTVREHHRIRGTDVAHRTASAAEI